MWTVAITNHKGGSAKTTTTVNLGAAMAAEGQRVLIIDMDPQGSASAWLGVPDSAFDVTRAILGKAALAELVHETTAAGVHLIPSSPMLVAQSGKAEADLADGFVRAMEELPAIWDVVLVDCPPTLGHLAVAPLAACSGALIPVEAHFLALSGVSSLLTMIERVREQLNARLDVYGILACRTNATTHSRLVVDRIREAYPALCMEAQVRESVRLAEAPGFRAPITTFAPGSTGDLDYRSAARELSARLQKLAPSPKRAAPAASALARVIDLKSSRPWVDQPSVLGGGSTVEPGRDTSS